MHRKKTLLLDILCKIHLPAWKLTPSLHKQIRLLGRKHCFSLDLRKQCVWPLKDTKKYTKFECTTLMNTHTHTHTLVCALHTCTTVMIIFIHGILLFIQQEFSLHSWHSSFHTARVLPLFVAFFFSYSKSSPFIHGILLFIQQEFSLHSWHSSFHTARVLPSFVAFFFSYSKSSPFIRGILLFIQQEFSPFPLSFFKFYLWQICVCVSC